MGIWSERLSAWAELSLQKRMLAINACFPIEIVYPDKLDEAWLQALLGSLYVVILLIGCFGNSLVLYALTCKCVEFNVRNIFIWSLTLADLFVCATALPLTAIHNFTRVWPFGWFMCQSVPLLQASSVFITSFTLVTIAWDRYLLLVYPGVKKMNCFRAVILELLVWVCGVCASTPYAAFMKYLDSGAPGPVNGSIVCGVYCEEDWPNLTLRRAYGSAVFVFQFLLPLVACTTCYVGISIKLKERFIERCAIETSSARTKYLLQKRRRQVNKMIACMLFSFVGAWLPIHIVNALRDFEIMGEDDWSSTIFVITHLTAMTSVIWNPIIYSFCNDQFRGIIRPILIKLRLLSDQTESKPSKLTLFLWNTENRIRKLFGKQPRPLVMEPPKKRSTKSRRPRPSSVSRGLHRGSRFSSRGNATIVNATDPLVAQTECNEEENGDRVGEGFQSVDSDSNSIFEETQEQPSSPKNPNFLTLPGDYDAVDDVVL